MIPNECPRCGEPLRENLVKQDLREVLAGLRDAGRQAYRQIGLFLEDGQRERLIVAQAILDPKAEQEPQCIEYCGDLRHPDGCEPVGPDDEPCLDHLIAHDLAGNA